MRSIMPGVLGGVGLPEGISAERLETVLMYWIDSESCNAIQEFAEPIYAALNLYRLLLLRRVLVNDPDHKARPPSPSLARSFKF